MVNFPPNRIAKFKLPTEMTESAPPARRFSRWTWRACSDVVVRITMVLACIAIVVGMMWTIPCAIDRNTAAQAQSRVQR